MHRNRTWSVDATKTVLRTQRNRILPIKGGDGSTLTLDFTTGVLDSRVTFTRGGNATFINSSGLVQFPDSNLVVNSGFGGTSPGTGWTTNGAGSMTSTNGVFTASTTTATTAFLSRLITVSSGLRYSASVNVTTVTGTINYNEVLTIGGTFSNVLFHRNGSLVGPGGNGVAQAQTGLITVTWTCGGINTIRFGIGASGTNIANATVVLDSPRVVLGNFLQPTYFASTTTAEYHGPRFDHDPITLAPKGLLIEGSATNICTFSGDLTQNGAGHWTARTNLDTSAWTGFTAPDDTTTAVKLIPNTTNGLHNIQNVSVSITSGVAHTASAFLKADGRTTAGLAIGATQAWQNFVLIGNGSLGSASTSPAPTSATITPVGNSGWYRVTMTWTSTTSASGVPLFVTLPSTSSTSPFSSFAGNGTQDGVQAWGAQFEVSSFASSYIVTGSSQATRNADTAIIAAGTNFTSWYQGGTQGTFYADWFGGVRPGATGNTNRTVLSTSNVTNQHLQLMQTAAAGNLRVSDFGGANNVTTANTLTSGNRTKGAFSYNGSTANVCLNGGTVATGSSLAFSATPTWLVIGATSTNGTSITDANVVLNNCVRVVKYWPTVLSNATLQSITT